MGFTNEILVAVFSVHVSDFSAEGPRLAAQCPAGESDKFESAPSTYRGKLEVDWSLMQTMFSGFGLFFFFFYGA